VRTLPDSHPLCRMFAGLTEHAFQSSLGVADPPLIDYISELLSRFLHVDAVYRIRNGQGQPLEEVADMLIEAQTLPEGGRTQREVYRHIGDFTLFWTGLFPEVISKLRSRWCKDHFINYTESGKRSYYRASQFVDSTCEAESVLLARLSREFELCAYGLHQVRKEWEEMAGEVAIPFRGRLLGS